MFRTQEIGKLLLELDQVLLHDIGTARHHLAQRLGIFVAALGEQRRIVEEGNIEFGHRALLSGVGRNGPADWVNAYKPKDRSPKSGHLDPRLAKRNRRRFGWGKRG